METAVQEEQPPTQQSAVRQRKGHSWIALTGVPGEAMAELFDLKVELGLKFRDDVIAVIVGEIGFLPAAIKAGLPLTQSKKEGGCSVYCYLPDALVKVITATASDFETPLYPGRALAAALMGVRSRFKELTRAGFARRLGGA